MGRLDDIEARLKAATPGPWHWDDGMTYGAVRDPEGTEVVGGNYAGAHIDDPDAALIAHTPDDLAYLLRVARAAERLSVNGKPALHSRRPYEGDGDPGCTSRCVACLVSALRRALEGDVDA